MLNIFYGDMPEAVFNTEVFFKNSYADEWIVDYPGGSFYGRIGAFGYKVCVK